MYCSIDKGENKRERDVVFQLKSSLSAERRDNVKVWVLLQTMSHQLFFINNLQLTNKRYVTGSKIRCLDFDTSKVQTEFEVT